MKKIGYFLMIMLVLWSVLLLDATRNSRPKEPAETTVQTDTTETSAVPETTEAQQEISRVEQILSDRGLDQTAVSAWVYERELNYMEGTTGTARTSHARDLAEVTSARRMNPIAAFWALVEEDLYRMETDASGVLAAAAFETPEQAAEQYPYTDEGAWLLLTDLLALSSRMGGELDMEQILLGADGALEIGQVFLADQEGCRYGYFTAGGERSTHFLCFYLRSDAKGVWIRDVEFQLLNLRSAEGEGSALSRLDKRGEDQAAALMAAAELLMTGKTGANLGSVPFSRKENGYSAEVERFCFTSGSETGALINYRLMPVN